MRLIMILIFGGILIGATYAWSSSLNHDDAGAADLELQKTYKRHSVTTTTRPLTSASTTSDLAESPNIAQANSEVTTIDNARQKARASAGKPDPFAPIEATMPFPRNSGSVTTTTVTTAKKVTAPDMVPPPPAGAGVVNDFAGMPGPHNGFAPPPPPSQGGFSTGLSISDMPLPPEKPGVAKLLKLSGIIGDKAIFQAKDLYTRRMQKWPGQIILSPGESFGTLKLISTRPESALVEEHGETIEIDLPAVR